MDFEYVHKIESKLKSMPDSEIIDFINRNGKSDKEIEDKHLKTIAISLLHDENKKIEYISKLGENDRFIPIKSLTNYQNKIKCIGDLEDEKWIAEFSRELLEDKDKLKNLDRIENLEFKVHLLESYKGLEKDIIESVKDIQNDTDKSLLLTKIKDDKIKIETLDNIKDEKSKLRVIRSLNEDDLKLEYIDNIRDNDEKTLLIASLKDNETKRKLMNIKPDKKMDIPNGMTVGMEIESEGKYSTELLISDNILEGWNSKRDSSLENGVEVVSPVMTNDEKYSKDIYTVCEILSNLGQNTSERCGGHIHIGADYLKTKDSYKNLLELWGNNEKIIYMICNDKEDVIRDGAFEFAFPISKKIQNGIDDFQYDNVSKEEFIDKLKDIQTENKQGEGRRSGLNLLNIGENDKNTIEFRISNGTINPNTWIENANLFAGIVKASQQISEIKGKQPNERAKEEKDILNKFDALYDEKLPEKERLNLFLDLTITEDNKSVYTERYEKNKKLIETGNIEQQFEENISDKPIIFDPMKIGKTTVNISTKEKDILSNRIEQDLAKYHEKTAKFHNQKSKEHLEEMQTGMYNIPDEDYR